MSKKPNPPTNVTILTIFVLSITSWNIIRAYSAITNWQVLVEFQANPAYILATGVIWALVGLWLFQGIMKGYHYTIRASLAAAWLYYIWYWCDRLFVQSSPALNVNFSAIFSTIFLAIFSLLLSIPSTKAFFNKE